ncbi:glucosamine-6-phosphate deaminase [Williamsoniiplasma lucivorax]|uniref:Glucosamine-6-phosphate deaminase n=1 Tax=Williamsoniiplasma lucivorax TaxID=209274 RepID=A0A2S5R9X4_9MOLU|nr:glucosamine-6-phosphate deaminase [Williamsoniiplasma lucivorax]PPE04108.1 glucosamine-6-phosphate deaminase [Williamsoniiplasma lucivorax]
MKIIKVKNNEEAGVVAAQIIEQKIQTNPQCVLGLATGSTPISTYQHLIKDYQNQKVSFKDVITYNLDEYQGLLGTHPESYRYFMNGKLFNHIDIKIENTHVPSGTDTKNPAVYDELIQQAGGIDLQLLGIGVNGHIGFNEPGTSFDSLTSVVDLTPSTIQMNARFFASVDLVPTKAVSMGLKTIMQSKQILLLATGANKAEAVAHLVNGEVSPAWPCTILQTHPDVIVIIDQEAGSMLK